MCYNKKPLYWKDDINGRTKTSPLDEKAKDEAIPSNVSSLVRRRGHKGEFATSHNLLTTTEGDVLAKQEGGVVLHAGKKSTPLSHQENSEGHDAANCLPVTSPGCHDESGYYESHHFRRHQQLNAFPGIPRCRREPSSLRNFNDRASMQTKLPITFKPDPFKPICSDMADDSLGEQKERRTYPTQCSKQLKRQGLKLMYSPCLQGDANSPMWGRMYRHANPAGEMSFTHPLKLGLPKTDKATSGRLMTALLKHPNEFPYSDEDCSDPMPASPAACKALRWESPGPCNTRVCAHSNPVDSTDSANLPNARTEREPSSLHHPGSLVSGQQLDRAKQRVFNVSGLLSTHPDPEVCLRLSDCGKGRPMCYWNSLPCDVGLMAVDKVTLTPIHMGEIEEPTQSIDLSGSASQMPPGDDGESQSKASEQGTPPDEPTFFPAQRVFPSSLDHGYGSNSNNDNQSSIYSTVCSELLDSVATIGPAKSTTKYRFIVAPSSCDEYAAPTTAGILGGPNELTALDHYCICECSSSECDCPEIRCFMCHKRPASEESSMHGKCKLPLPTVAHSARFANFPFIKANCVKKSDSPFGNVIYRSGALGDISSIQDWYGTRYPLYRLSDTCNLQDVGQNIKNLEERRVEIRPCDKREYLSCGDEQDGDPSICNAFKSPLSSSLTSFVSGKIHGTRNLRRCSHGKAPPTRLISSAGYFSSSGYSSSWHKHPAICLARGSTDLALPNADLRVLSSCSLLRKSSSLFGDQPQSHPASDSIAAKQPCRQGDASCPRQKRHVHSALRTDDRNAECRHFVSDDNGCPQYPKLSTRQCSKHRCLRQHPFNCGKRAKQGPAWKRNRSVPRPEYPLENGVSSTDDSLLNTQSPHSPGKTERRITRLLCTCQSESSQNHVAYPHDPPLYDKYDSAIDRRDVFDETTQYKPILCCLSFLGNDSGAETCGVD